MLLPTVPDTVPDYASDLLNEDIVSWFEDRTPISEIEVERRMNVMQSLLVDEELEEVISIRPSEIILNYYNSHTFNVGERFPYNPLFNEGYVRNPPSIIRHTRIVTPELETSHNDSIIVDDRHPYNPLFDEDDESNSGNIMFNAPPIKHNILLTMSVEDSDNLYRECCICLDEKHENDFIFCNCRHSFCGNCVKTMVIPTNKIKCPLCREEIITLDVKNVENYNLLSELIDL